MLGYRLADSERIEFVSEDFGGCRRDGNAACGGGEVPSQVQVQVQVHFAMGRVQVVEVVAAHRQLKKISFVAHSMGGLVARYAIGLLYVSPGAPFLTSSQTSGARPTPTRLPLANTLVADGTGRGDVGEGVTIESHREEVQERWGSRDGGTIAGLTPVNFVTIATPHLGCLGKGHVRG